MTPLDRLIPQSKAAEKQRIIVGRIAVTVTQHDVRYEQISGKAECHEAAPDGRHDDEVLGASGARRPSLVDQTATGCDGHR